MCRVIAPITYAGVKVLRFMLEFRFLKVWVMFPNCVDPVEIGIYIGYPMAGLGLALQRPSGARGGGGNEAGKS